MEKEDKIEIESKPAEKNRFWKIGIIILIIILLLAIIIILSLNVYDYIQANKNETNVTYTNITDVPSNNGSNINITYTPKTSVCGDGKCNGTENYTNCPRDCKKSNPGGRDNTPPCISDCNGKNCGGDGCGDSCGPCTNGICNATGRCVPFVNCTADTNCTAFTGNCGTGKCNTSTKYCYSSFNVSTTVCRNNVSECDSAELCSGSSANCGNDLNKTDGTSCSIGTCQKGICMATTSCGDTICNSLIGENCINCEADCGQCENECLVNTEITSECSCFLEVKNSGYCCSTGWQNSPCSIFEASHYVDNRLPMDCNSYNVLSRSCSGGTKKAYNTVQKAIDELKPGNVLAIREGIYRESISIRINGTKDKRIIIRNYPGENAVLEGTTQLLGWEKCTDASCLSLRDKIGVINPNYPNIYKLMVPESFIGNIVSVGLFENGEMLQISQWPDQPSPFVENWGLFNRLKDTRNLLQNKYIWDPKNLTEPDDYWNSTIVRVWLCALNNNIEVRQISDYILSEGKLEFNIPLTKNITNSCSGNDSYTLINHQGPKVFNRAGEFYIKPTVQNGKYEIFIWPKNEIDIDKIGISQFGRAVYINKGYGSHITFDGLKFRGYIGDGTRSGGIIVPAGFNHEGIYVRNCEFKYIKGYAAIDLLSGSGDIVENNNISDIAGDGILASGYEFKAIGNYLSDTSGTLLKINVIKGIVDRNYILKGGGHANGISVYEGNDKILIVRNKIRSNHANTYNACSNIIIHNNLFEGSSNGVRNWDGACQNMSIYNNILIGNIGLQAPHSTVVSKNNIISSGWTARRSNNIYVARSWNQGPKYSWILGEKEIVADGTSIYGALYQKEDVFSAYEWPYLIKPDGLAKDSGANIIGELPSWVNDPFFSDYYDFSKDINGKSKDSKWDIGPYEI